MLDSEKILEKMVTRLLVRMVLRREHHGGPGTEAVEAQLVGYHYDDDGPVMAFFSYESSEGMATGRLSVTVEANPTKFGELAEHVVSLWQKGNGWLVDDDAVFYLYTSEQHPSATHWLPSGNILVLQHMARIQGAIGQSASTHNSPDDRAVIATTARRIQGVIRQGNAELSRLARLI